jgi:hypothetical protein
MPIASSPSGNQPVMTGKIQDVYSAPTSASLEDDLPF